MSLSSADIKAEDAVRLPGNYATVGGANVEVRNKLQQLLKSNSQQQSSSFSIGDVTPSDDSDNGDANDKTQGTTGKKAPTEKQKSYVVMDTGGVQNASKFMESTEDQRYLTRHFPELALEQIRGVSSCALEKDVLWHGKLIFTNKHLCFRGKLFAKAVKLVVPFNDILAIEKKSTVLIPNAIRIVTLHAKVILTVYS